MRERAAADDRPVTRADTGKSRHLAHSPFRPKTSGHMIMIVTNGAFSNDFRKFAVVRRHNKKERAVEQGAARSCKNLIYNKQPPDIAACPAAVA